MNKLATLFVIASLLVGSNAYAATAYFTGRQQMVQSVTNQMVWNCEYQYAGNYFWRAYQGSCPFSVEVY